MGSSAGGVGGLFGLGGSLGGAEWTSFLGALNQDLNQLLGLLVSAWLMQNACFTPNNKLS